MVSLFVVFQRQISEMRYQAGVVFLCYSVFRRVGLLLERYIGEISFLILKISIWTSDIFSPNLKIFIFIVNYLGNKRDIQSSLGFCDTNGSPNLGQMTRLVTVNNHKERENILNRGLCRLAEDRKKER